MVGAYRGDECLWRRAVSYTPSLALATSSGEALLIGYESDFIGDPVRFEKEDNSSLFVTIISSDGVVQREERVPRGPPDYSSNPRGPAFPYVESLVLEPDAHSLGVLLRTSKETPPEVRWFDAATGEPKDTQRAGVPDALPGARIRLALDVCYLEPGCAMVELWLLHEPRQSSASLVRIVPRDPSIETSELLLDRSQMFRFASIERSDPNGAEEEGFICTLRGVADEEVILHFRRVTDLAEPGTHWEIKVAPGE